MNTKQIRKYLPKILSIFGSGGVIATGYFSAKAGIAIKEIALDETKTKEQKRKEILKEAMPACLSAGVTIGCIVSSDILNGKNTKDIKTEMAAGYVLLQNSYNQYRKKIDKETNERVLKKISEEKVKLVEVPITVYEKELYPWCDSYHDEPWYAREGDVYWAAIYLKERFRKRFQVSLHDFYEVLRRDRGVNIPYVPNEEELVWDMDVVMLEWETDEITFSALYDENPDGTRIYTLDFFIPPYPDSAVRRIIKELEEK